MPKTGLDFLVRLLLAVSQNLQQFIEGFLSVQSALENMAGPAANMNPRLNSQANTGRLEGLKGFSMLTASWFSQSGKSQVKWSNH